MTWLNRQIEYPEMLEMSSDDAKAYMANLSTDDLLFLKDKLEAARESGNWLIGAAGQAECLVEDILKQREAQS